MYGPRIESHTLSQRASEEYDTTWELRKLAAVAAVVAMVVLPGDSALAAAGAPPVGTPALVHLTDAQARTADLETIAASRGWTIAQARAQYDLAERVRPVHQAIAVRAPEVFAGTVLPATPGGLVGVLVKGAAPAFVRETVAASALPISIVEHQPYSLAELSARSDAVHDRLKAMGFRSIATGVDFGDFEWATTFGVPVVDDFFGGSNEIRDVTGVRALSAMMAGDQACVFGRTTGLRKCSTIFQFNVAVTDARGTSRRHVAVMDNITLAGDSGAPWFVNTLAYGVHTGTITLDRAARSVFSPADLIDEALGVQIMT